MALGKLAVTLVALVVARRVQLTVQRKVHVSGRSVTGAFPSLVAIVGGLCAQLSGDTTARRPQRKAVPVRSRRATVPTRAAARRTASY